MSRDANAPVFSVEAARELACVLDAIIPPSADGRLPGAGELGLVSAVEAAVRKTPDLEPALDEGLAALGERARSRGESAFSALPAADRRDVLNDVAAAAPAFLPGLIFHVYVAYYQHARVLEGLGVPPRPPHPEGYELEPGDFTLLDRVRARPKLYREC